MRESKVMHRTPIVAGNWKMYKGSSAGLELARAVASACGDLAGVSVVLAPPFTLLERVAQAVRGSRVEVAGQNLHAKAEGAFTGEVSAPMLLDAGCKWVIIGHSERRQYFGETDVHVNKKVLAALRRNLKPIVCCGETLDERENGKTLSKIRSQVKNGLAGLAGSAIRDIVIAYEPIWAIGTGKTASPLQAEEVHNAIRELLYELFDADAVKEARVIYGGSVKADNIDELMSQPNIDGALVGGASLKAEEFARIVKFQPV